MNAPTELTRGMNKGQGSCQHVLRWSCLPVAEWRVSSPGQPVTPHKWPVHHSLLHCMTGYHWKAEDNLARSLGMPQMNGIVHPSYPIEI